jgi:Fe-S-cluster containining protein
MTDSHNRTDETLLIDAPAYWDEEALHRKWLDFLESSVSSGEVIIPVKRLQLQIEQTTDYLETMRGWSRMDASTRLKAWKRLLEAFENIVQKVLPACVQCGECCRKGSPTLHVEDLELLQQGNIPWPQLLTLRKGEAAYSPFDKKPFLLASECIKLREKPGSNVCVFLYEQTSQCGIYPNRPLQCRAQACWDPTVARQLSKMPYLTRQEIFGEVELLMDIIAEHEQRCAFEKLNEAFARLAESKGSSVNEVLELLAYEDHFRQFFGERLNIPGDILDLVFGRSFADLMPLFGFRVVTEPDGSRCLIPERG